MITDSRTIPAGNVLESDLCIVGGGPAGITIAREFLRSNIRVCLLEGGGFEFDPQTHALNDGKTLGDAYANPAETRCRRFGGTAHSWVTLAADGLGGRYVPLDAIDFEERPYVPYSGWPFDKTHLDPYYVRAHEVCGLGPYRYDAEAWLDSTNRVLPFAGDRVYTGVYHTGASRLFTATYTDQIGHGDNVNVCLYANVFELTTDNTGERVTTARAACLTGTRFSVHAKWFVLATGGIENPRILLLSNSRHPNGLGNQHGLVGQFFMEHPRMFSCDFVPSNTAMFDAMSFYDIHLCHSAMIGGRLGLTEAVMRRDNLLNSSVIFFPVLRGEHSTARKAVTSLRAQLRKRSLSVRILPLLVQVAVGMGGLVGYSYRRFVRGNKPVLDGWSALTDKRRRFGSFDAILHLEQAPDPENRVTLGTERDALGLPKVEIHWRWTTLDNDSARRTRAILAEEIERAHLGQLVIEEKAVLQGSVHHHLGTTRMHSNPRKGVVNENCRVHGISNLYIAGSSVFPTGGYANPTLTIVALALRLSDHLRGVILASQ